MARQLWAALLGGDVRRADAAVDEERRSGDERRIVTGEERDGCGDLVRLSEATASAGAPWYKGFGSANLKFVNYTPIVVFGLLLALWVWWHLSVKNWFTGPRVTIDLPEGVSSTQEIELEQHGQTAHGQPIREQPPDASGAVPTA